MIRAEIQKACDIQKEYCKENGYPYFAPSDGICYYCNSNIYDLADPRQLVTGCPHCHRSYCD